MAGNSIDQLRNCDPDTPATLPPLPAGVAAGRLVSVRGAEWRLRAVVDHADCCELHLAGIDGGSRVLLWPFDRPSGGEGPARLRTVRLQTWARQAGRALAQTVDPRAPRVAFRGLVLPYQLAPALAVASGAARVLLADEVGLGKTIQAGWIVADAVGREPCARVLVAVPAGLRDQWIAELRTFFDLSAVCVDAAWLRAAVADRPADVSPWAAPGIYLGSIDFLKRPDVARSLTSVAWELLVADEAHAAAAPTERHALLARVALVARCIVVITATPYSGDTGGFASMMALGAAPGEPEPLMFRRSREEVGDGRRRRHRFATVRIGRAEFRLQRLLERYTRDVWRDAPGDADAARLAMTILRKRALSSPAAALRSLTRRQELLRGAAPALRQLSLFDEPPETDDVLPDAALAAPGLLDAGLEARRLAELADAAVRAAASDSKRRRLLRLLGRVGGEAAIVFTEYRDTLRALAAVLPDALQLHGGLTGAERAAVQRTFNGRGGILLATDAAAEGLNLQGRCRLLVNYELPWNPARLEQRIGRIDRIGQRRTVHAISFVARDTAEDLVVAALARRLARVAATLGERDRLAALLTDARTARAVITGEPLAAADGEALRPAIRRPRAVDYPVDRVAAEVASRTETHRAPAATVVASMRARAPVSAGRVVVVRAAAVTDRGLVADRSFLVHLADARMTRPATRREARERARDAVDLIARAAPGLAEVRQWFAEAAGVHRAAVAARLAREEWLRRGTATGGGVQPGLFDRRVARDAERRAEADGRRGEEHDRRVAALTACLDLRLACTVEAVLIAWR